MAGQFTNPGMPHTTGNGTLSRAHYCAGGRTTAICANVDLTRIRHVGAAGPNARDAWRILSTGARSLALEPNHGIAPGHKSRDFVAFDPGSYLLQA